MRARHDDTGSGRWTSRDSLNSAGTSMGAYTYCESNPILHIDPSGFMMKLHLPICKGDRPWNPGPPPGPWPPSDPAYSCYAAACRWWNKRSQDCDDFADRLCGGSAYPWNIIVCTMTNLGLPEIKPSDECYKDCYVTGGQEENAPGTGNMCCIECGKRVCCWILRPCHRMAESERDRRLLECMRKFRTHAHPHALFP